MHADRYFAQGKGHKVNQDYAKAGVIDPPLWRKDKDPIVYGIVSDGCSGDGTADTDVGSRLMTLSTIQRLRIWDRVDTGLDWIFHEAAGKVASWDEDLNCLDATLLVVQSTSEKTVRVVAVGDGVYASRHHDGTITMVEIEFEPAEDGNVYPFYLSYLNNPYRLRRYLEIGGGMFRKTKTVLSPSGEILSAPEVSDPSPMLELSEDGTTRVCPVIEDFHQADAQCVAVFSDGIQTFLSGTASEVPTSEILANVMAIKNSAGEFVHRRCHRFMASTAQKNGWHHYDDFSMAAIWMGE